MSAIDLAQLAALPDLVQALQQRVQDLERRLVVAERQPLTVALAARALGVSQKTIRRRVAAGELQHQWVGRRVTVYLDP